MSELMQLKTLVKETLTRAKNAEQTGCALQACDLYEIVMDQISDLLNYESSAAQLRVYQRNLDKVYMQIEELRNQFNYHNRHGRLQDQIYIKADTMNMSYDKIFGKYLTTTVKELLFYSPQFSRRSHIKNFLHFMELVVTKCPNLCYVRLATIAADKHMTEQHNTLMKIRNCLANKEITFHFRFMNDLNEHMIILNTGYIFQSEHGLNYFQRTDSPFILGICDYDFRKCLKTHFLVWRTSPYRQAVPNQTSH